MRVTSVRDKSGGASKMGGLGVVFYLAAKINVSTEHVHLSENQDERRQDGGLIGR